MRVFELERALRERAVTSDGQLYSVISLKDCKEAAELVGVCVREAEIFALSVGVCPMRYERNIGTFGLEGQRRLLESCAAVVGLGGLGGLIAELLARSGVGRLVLADGDVFSESNLNRQLLCSESDIGRSKAECAGSRVRAINGAISVKVVNYALDKSNISSILDGTDVVLDALDSNSARVLVSDYCRASGIPFVHGAIGGMWAQTGVFMPDDRRPWEIFSEYEDKGDETLLGNPPFTASFAASLEVSLAAAVICGKPVKSGILHWCDLSDISLQNLKL